MTLEKVTVPMPGRGCEGIADVSVTLGVHRDGAA